MKKFMSVILATLMVIAVSASVVNGTAAGFFDVEISTENYMCAGTRSLEISGIPINAEHAWPCQWFEEEYVLLNTGSLDSTAYIHFPDKDDPDGDWEGFRCEEAGTINGEVYSYAAGGYIPGTPVNGMVATTESELSAEEGGCVGEKADGTPVYVNGLGIDACNICDFIDVEVLFEDELKVSGRLSEIACTLWELGTIPASESNNNVRGGGWGSYFKYHVGGEPIEVTLVGGQIYSTGIVKIWDDGTNLYIEYNTTGTGWKLSETNVYVGKYPPPSLSPGKFKDWGGAQHAPISPPSETDSYMFSLSDIFNANPPYKCNYVFLAVHAIVCHPDLGCETGWGKGVYRKVKIRVHWDDIPEEYFNNEPWWPGGKGFFDEDNPAEAKWDHWPTNAFMGDRCTFDIVFHMVKPQ